MSGGATRASPASLGAGAPGCPDPLRLLPGKAAWLCGRLEPAERGKCEELARLWGEVQEEPTEEQGPLAALLAMLEARITLHSACRPDGECKVAGRAGDDDQQEEAPAGQDWVVAGSVNLVTRLTAAYVVRAGYEYLTEAELAARRDWAELLAIRGIGVRHLLYGWAVPQDVGLFMQQVQKFNASYEEWSGTCRKIEGLQWPLFAPSKPDKEKRNYPYWLPRATKSSGTESTRRFYLIRHILPVGQNVSTLLARERKKSEHRRVLESVYKALHRYVELLRQPEGGPVYGCLDLRFDNMLQLQEGNKSAVRLIDLEPYDRWTFPLPATPAWESSLREQSAEAWALALYLYTVANSIGNLLVDMEIQRVHCQPATGGQSSSSHQQQDDEATSSCPFAEAVAMLRKKARKLGQGGQVESGLARGLHLLAGVGWEGTHTPRGFLERIERYVDRAGLEYGTPLAFAFHQHYLDAKQTGTADLADLIGSLVYYALACHHCRRVPPESIKTLQKQLDSLRQLSCPGPARGGQEEGPQPKRHKART